MKTNSISIRLNELEKMDIETKAQTSNMSVSNYVRKMLSSDPIIRNVNPETNLILGNMSTELNKYWHDGNNTHIKKIERMMRELWQIL